MSPYYKKRVRGNNPISFSQLIRLTTDTKYNCRNSGKVPFAQKSNHAVQRLRPSSEYCAFTAAHVQLIAERIEIRKRVFGTQ